MAMFKVEGVNDDTDFCECCGKTGLKKVVWITNLETLETKHFGTTCALQPAKGFGLSKEIKRAVAKHAAIEKDIWANTWRKYKRMGGKFNTLPNNDGWTYADLELRDKCYAECKQDMAEALAAYARMKRAA